MLAFLSARRAVQASIVIQDALALATAHGEPFKVRIGLRQILGVLLENAISHSPPGSQIDVNASCEVNTLVIDVSNEGSLPAEITSEELFRPFQRGADARSAGVGLGLYVAAKLAESMEGFITAQSTEDKVTFSFSYPLGKVVSRSTA